MSCFALNGEWMKPTENKTNASFNRKIFESKWMPFWWLKSFKVHKVRSKYKSTMFECLIIIRRCESNLVLNTNCYGILMICNRHLWLTLNTLWVVEGSIRFDFDESCFLDSNIQKLQHLTSIGGHGGRTSATGVNPQLWFKATVAISRLCRINAKANLSKINAGVDGKSIKFSNGWMIKRMPIN